MLSTYAVQDLFRQMSVFAGAFDLAAIEAVCASASERDLLDLLAALVDKSLVVVEERAGRTEYRLLDSLRVFARAALASGELYASDPAKAAALAKTRSEHARVLAQAEEEWLAAGEALQATG